MTDMYLTRKVFTNNSTVGKLVMDDLEIFTLEDTARRVKVEGETCIPSGSYNIEIRKSNRYGRPMPFLIDVPFYDGIMLHWGNYPKDTLGCIIVGQIHPTVDMVGESVMAFDKLYPKIAEALLKGPVKIHIAGGFTKEDFNQNLNKVVS